MKQTIHEVANLYIRTMTFEGVGDVMEDGGHVHTYDHAHFLSSGRVRVEVNGQATDYTAPALVYIKAGVLHRMTALEVNTVGHCIHALRSQDGSGEPLDPSLVPAGVTALEIADPITRPHN